MSRAAWGWLVVGACAGAPVDDAHEVAEVAPDAPHAHAEGTGAGEHLRVSPDVLRDLRVTTTAVRRATGEEPVSVLGELAVDDGRYAEVGSLVRARVASVRVSPGDVVRAGDVVVTLESAEVGAARAGLMAARAAKLSASASADRKRTLLAGVVSARELADADAEVAARHADEVAAEAVLRGLGVPVSVDGGATFALRSPVGGVVLSRDVHVGEVVSEVTTVARVADLGHLWLVAHAFERDALRVSEGTAVQVSLAALPNRTFAGTVTRVGDEVDPTSRTVPVRVELDNPEGTLRPGMSATVRLPLVAADGVVTAPASAVQRCEAGWCVFLPGDAPGEFEVRPVGRGRELGADVELVSGVAEGDTVVVDGAFLLRAEAAKRSGGGDAHDH